MLRQLFVQAMRRDWAHHIRAEHARHGHRFCALFGGFERQLHGPRRELRRAVLHTNLRQRARCRVTRERGEYVRPAPDLDLIVLANLVGTFAQQLAEGARHVQRDSARAQARVAVDRNHERPAG